MNTAWLPVAAAALTTPLMAMEVEHGALEMYRPLPNVLYTRARGQCTNALADVWVRCTQDIWPSVDKLVAGT